MEDLTAIRRQYAELIRQPLSQLRSPTCLVSNLRAGTGLRSWSCSEGWRTVCSRVVNSRLTTADPIAGKLRLTHYCC